MSSSKRSGGLGSFVVFGVPIALAALFIPALFVLVPSRSTAPTTVPVAPTPAPVTTMSHGTAGMDMSATTAPATNSREVVLTVKEWGFAPDQLELPAGQPVTLVLDNKGQLDHDVSIPALGVQLKAAAGKSARQTVTASKTGAFDFVCSIAGHKEAGMQGRVVVGDSAIADSRVCAGASICWCTATWRGVRPVGRATNR